MQGHPSQLIADPLIIKTSEKLTSYEADDLHPWQSQTSSLDTIYIKHT